MNNTTDITFSKAASEQVLNYLRASLPKTEGSKRACRKRFSLREVVGVSQEVVDGLIKGSLDYQKHREEILLACTHLRCSPLDFDFKKPQ